MLCWQLHLPQLNGKSISHLKHTFRCQCLDVLYQSIINSLIITQKAENNNCPKRMKPKPITISHLETNQQQVPTPSWGTSQRTQFQKMSRLDQLLSRNQQIYQNMRNQLQEISKSNQNIDANINIIKPFYESGGYGESAEDGEDGEDGRSTYKQSYTFENKMDSIPSSNNSLGTKATNYGNPAEKRQQPTRPVDPIQNKMPSIQQNPYTKTKQIPSSSSSKSSLNPNNVYLQHPPKKVLQKVPNILQSGLSSYHEPDSSPIQSENFMQSVRSNQFQKQKQCTTNSYIDRIRSKYSEMQSQKNQSEGKYQTFEQDPRISAIDQKQQQQSQEKENQADNYKNEQSSRQNQSHQNLSSNRYLELHTQKLQLPSMLPLVFIPFNRLYSSPILQQITKNQLILARRSKTQVVSNSCVNRIVNGIKYRNVNLYSEEIAMYEKIMERVRKVEDLLRAMRQRRELKVVQEESRHDGQIKDSVDIGIVGGHNSLKKKLHYALIAHVYTDILNQVTAYFESQASEKYHPGTLLFTIEHQQQQTNSDPSIISYQGEISPSLSQSQNQMVYGNIEAVIQQIFQQMKTKVPTPEAHNIHRIRVTRLCLQIITISKQVSQNSQIQARKLHTIANTKIISTNKIDKQFIEDLQLDVAVWCVNPLFKYYDETYNILQSYAAVSNKRDKISPQGRESVSQGKMTRKETKTSFRGVK